MNELNIYRLNTSPYLGDSFYEKEKHSFAKIGLNNYFTKFESKDQDKKVLITNTHTNLTSIPAKHRHSIELIIHPNSGHDNLQDCKENFDCPIILGNEIRSHAVSEYILSCVFHRFTSIEFTHKWSKNRTWQRDLLKFKNVLIYGHGHIGQILVQALTPLTKSVQVHDPRKNKSATLNNEFDIIILACSLHEDNFQLVDESFLAQVKKDVTLINPARGKLINMPKLMEFLTQNPNSRAYLDVFPQEPCALEEFNHLSNLYCSSHIAGVYKELPNQIIKFNQQVLLDFVRLDKKQFSLKYKDITL